MNNLIGLTAGLTVVVVVLVLSHLSTSGRLDRWSDRVACTVLATGGVLILAGALVLWMTLPIGWRWWA